MLLGKEFREVEFNTIFIFCSFICKTLLSKSETLKTDSTYLKFKEFENPEGCLLLTVVKCSLVMKEILIFSWTTFTDVFNLVFWITLMSIMVASIFALYLLLWTSKEARVNDMVEYLNVKEVF